MIPSSSSNLSVKSHGSRPSSSLSRPASRNTSRPSSSTTPRPASSLSIRPASSASTRPQSRFSQRPHSRHARSRLIPICQTLVSQITGLNEEGTEKDVDSEEFRELVEYAVKNLETSTINKAAASVDLSVIDRQISGHALKARINSRDALGEALESAYKKLKLHLEEREADLDQDIKASRIPDHLQLLLALSESPSDGTVEMAKTYLETVTNPPPPPPTLTWADILAEEPFEGEHWEGDRAERDEWDSTPSLSPLNSDDLILDDEDDSLSSAGYEEPASPISERAATPPEPANLPYTYKHRKQFEELRAKQYWRDDWHTDASLVSRFDIGDPSTLGPNLSRILARASGFQDAQRCCSQMSRYIDEDDMVREILMTLQGNRNIVLAWKGHAYTIGSSEPGFPRIHYLIVGQNRNNRRTTTSIRSARFCTLYIQTTYQQ
ncbi:hypothetical protein BDZ97DRAFT_1921610 [Flammula alnicola]|nr:hypothetical protein BDZ97DRAFT_1921610 [Flammula alnicola]